LNIKAALDHAARHDQAYLIPRINALFSTYLANVKKIGQKIGGKSDIKCQ
jgi:hypothetical protein